MAGTRPRRAGSALPLLLLAAACAFACATAQMPADSRAPRRQLLDKPCCEDCKSVTNSVAKVQCFSDCQSCVSASQCADLSQSVAGPVAQVACEYADSKCRPAGTAALTSGQVTRRVCYKAAKNICLTFGRDYAEANCRGYKSGVGSCDNFKWRQYFNEELGSQCDDIAKGVAILLP